jgi:hypothetical protein
VAVRSCLVTLTEPDGPSHRVQVEAETLYEAAALGLAAFKQHGWSPTIGPATRLEIQILEPSVVHTVSVQQVQRWLSGATASPYERVRKDRLRALIG